MTKMVKMNKIMKLHIHSKFISWNISILHSEQQDGHVIQNFHFIF